MSSLADYTYEDFRAILAWMDDDDLDDARRGFGWGACDHARRTEEEIVMLNKAVADELADREKRRTNP